MKKIKYLILFFIAALAYFGCEDYTEDFPVPPASLVPEFTYTSTTGFAPPDDVQFSSEPSIIPDRVGTVNYLWDFGDGNTSTEANPTHTFTEEGDFTIVMTISSTVTNDEESYSETLHFESPKDTIFKEDFEEMVTFPEDWVLVNVDGNTPDNQNYETMKDSAWIISYSSTFESNVALGISFYNPEAAADDWMITPKITLKNNPFLEWKAMSLTTSGDYPDSYEIYVSTTTQDVAGCQANGRIYRILDEEAGEDADNPGNGIQTHKISLDDFAGQDVYIAFRLNTPDPGGDRLAIDDITVVNE